MTKEKLEEKPYVLELWTSKSRFVLYDSNGDGDDIVMIILSH